MSINAKDYLLATRDERIVQPDVMLTEATQRRHFFYSRMLQNSLQEEKGGDNLVDYVQYRTNENFKRYNPLGGFTPTSQNKNAEIKVPWTFAESNYSLVREINMLNEGGTASLYNTVMSEEMGCVTDMVEGLESDLWAEPNKELMEDTVSGQQDAQEPYSILCFVTRDGLAPSSTNGGVAAGSSDWSTLQTLTVSGNSWYQNQHNTYSAADKFDPTNGIIPAFDDMQLRVDFQLEGPLGQYAPSEQDNKLVIATNRDGMNLYRQAMRSVNDQMDRLNDAAVTGLAHNGIPLRYVSELDGRFTDGQPDYLWLDLNFLLPFVHNEQFMDEQIIEGGENHPNKTFVFKFIANNLICRSRRRQGRISAAA